MLTPLATVKGMLPGNLGFTSSRLGAPDASCLTCTFATDVRPIAVATARP